MNATNKLLFFNDIHLDDINCTFIYALQLRNQHNILLIGDTSILYNFKTKQMKQLHHLKNNKVHGHFAAQLADGTVAVLTHTSLCLCDPITLDIRDKLTVHTEVIAVAGDNLIAPKGEDIQIWNVETMSCIKTLIGHEEATITCMLLLSHGVLASCSFDKTIRIWNIFNGDCLYVLRGHSKNVWGIIKLDNSIVSCGYDNTIRFWDRETKECTRVVQGFYQRGCLYKLIAKPDRTIIALGTKSYSYRDDKGIQELPNGEGACCAVVIKEYPYLPDYNINRQ
jgi:WD40 repeat protein